MSTYLPTGSTQISAPKPATESLSDALKRAKEIAAKLTGKVSSPLDANNNKRPLEEREEPEWKRYQDDYSTNDAAQFQQGQDTTPVVYVAPKQLKTTMEFIVPGYKVGLIIGTRGETLKRIERETDTKITFDPLTTANPADMPERKVMITGLPDDCEKCKKMVLEKIHVPVEGTSGTPGFMPSADPMIVLSQMPVFKDAFGNPLPSVQFMIPNNKVGLVIGKGGETIRDLQERSGAKVFIAPDSTTVPNQTERLISISGNDEQITMAKQLLEEILEGGGQAALNRQGTVPFWSTSVTLIVPDNMVGLLIGKKGDYFKLMTSQSHAKIVIDPPVSMGTPTRTVTLTGAPESIAIAQQMIHDKLAPTNRLEGNTYYPIDASASASFTASTPTSAFYDPTRNASAAAAAAYFATPTTAPATVPSTQAYTAPYTTPIQYTKEQIDYYYAYYYDYYHKAGLDTTTAIQSALSAMTSAGIPIDLLTSKQNERQQEHEEIAHHENERNSLNEGQNASEQHEDQTTCHEYSNFSEENNSGNYETVENDYPPENIYNIHNKSQEDDDHTSIDNINAHSNDSESLNKLEETASSHEKSHDDSITQSESTHADNEYNSHVTSNEPTDDHSEHPSDSDNGR